MDFKIIRGLLWAMVVNEVLDIFMCFVVEYKRLFFFWQRLVFRIGFGGTSFEFVGEIERLCDGMGYIGDID